MKICWLAPVVFILRIGGVFHVKFSCLLWFDFFVLCRFLAVASNTARLHLPMPWRPSPLPSPASRGRRSLDQARSTRPCLLMALRPPTRQPSTTSFRQHHSLSGAFSSRKNLDKFFLATFITLIRSIKYILFIKLITRMDGKSRGESIKPN